MSKIRINELARQLEVKSREVIDKLHELGIAEKVTHSSSIDEDKADQLRRYYKGESYAPLPVASHRNGSGTAVEERSSAAEENAGSAEAASAQTGTETHAGPSAAAPLTHARAEAKPASGAPVSSGTGSPEQVPSESASPAPAEAEKKDDDHRPRAIPLRPPIMGRGVPIHPPMGGCIG